MCHRLFDEIQRTADGPAKRSEPHFPYVNRTAREHFETARTILEDWFSSFVKSNATSANDLRKRFRSKKDEHHLAALTELYLHQLLLDNGFDPVAHPKLGGIRTRPDFVALQNNIPMFVIEATLVYDDRVKTRLDKFEANIGDAIDRVKSPDFLISYVIDSSDIDHQPNTGAIVRFLQNNIDKLDYEQVYGTYEKTKELPEWSYSQGRWKLTFTATPVTKEARGRRTDSSRVAGMAFTGVRGVDVDAAIRDSVLEKSKRYGKFDIPFIIVVNVIRDSLLSKDDDTIMEALFGKEVFDVVTYADGSYKTNARRDNNGAWIHPQRGVVNNHVSGILVLPGLTSATVQLMNPVLWHHPCAAHPLDRRTLSVEQRYFDRETGHLKKCNIHK